MIRWPTTLIRLLVPAVRCLASDSDNSPGGKPNVNLLSAEECWKRMPPAASGAGQSLPSWARDVVPFAVNLKFDDLSRVQKFLSQRLFAAREKKFKDR